MDLKRVSEFVLPCHVLYNCADLHVFADASNKAYGAFAYTVDSITKRSNLLISKARVAPCKEGRLMIPKLELTASLIGARLIRYLSNIHQFKTIYLWSDSKVVISWITGDRELKDVYVANPVAEVKTILTRHSIQFKYVHTKDNPADYLSRGCSSKQLKSSNWLHGPSWLLTCEFPEQTNLEVVVNELTVEINPIHPVHPLIDLTRFSSFTRAIRVMTKVIEFCQSPANPFEKLIRQEQLLHCTSIHAFLNNPTVRVNVEVKTTVRQLSLYLENDTIRSKGRINNSELPLDAITPFFLPNKSYLVDLLIMHIHTSHNHIGLSQTLSLYRQRCWTPKIRLHIKYLLLRCVTCRQVKGRTLSQPLPPPLPAERVQWVPPFSHVGVDHMGSYVIRDPQGRKSKVYICLFVCATTRAVHLEVVEDLTTSKFIMCLRRLAATKGMPKLILSDNHRTFIAGETFLPDLQQDPSVREYLNSRSIRRKHQTPRSPWMGGHFERLVRTIKASLATAISRKLLSLEEFRTVVLEAENIVNSRPLTYQSDSTRDVPLSPLQLAWGRDLTLMPPLLQPGDPLDEDFDAKATRAQYELLSNALERFRKRWHSECLLSLREKHNNVCAEDPTHHLSVGQLVMVRHENVHRIEWPLGVITAVYPDTRGIIRTAEVEECGKQSRRLISYLVPLELDCRHDDDDIHLRPRERQRDAEEEDAIDHEEDDASYNDDSSELVVSEGLERQRFLPESPIVESEALSANHDDSNVTADTSGNMFLPDASAPRTSGSSRESGLAIGIHDGGKVSASPTVVPESLTAPPVATQTREGVEGDEGNALTNARPQRRAAQQQRALLSRLIEDDLLSVLPAVRDRQRSLGLFGVKGGILAKSVNIEDSSELLHLFFIFFTSDPVMNSCHKFIFCDLGQVLINYL